MIENLIDKHLKKQGFIRVPTSWSDDYKRLVEKHSAVSKVVRELGREYNEILRELAECKGSTWIKDALKELGVEFKKDINKEELINLYVQTFQVEFEDDFDEEITNDETNK